MFERVDGKVRFPDLERGILDRWAAEDTFRASIAQRAGAPEFVFYDGPPFATGLPHYGHLLAGTIKDIIPRYQTMRGRYVERRFGWDCHGLPVEYEMEQELKISGKREIERLGVAAFNEQCRGIVLRYTREWRQVVTRMGRWVDFDRDYKTMDPAYMESIWWVFKSLWEKGLVYEGNKIVPYCPRCATPLSNFETNQGYADTQDPAVTVRFELEDEPGAFVLAWTTTPWTLPSNLALAVGADIPYVKVQDGGEVYYLARERLPVFYRQDGGHRVVEELPGRALAGRRYRPLFPYFADLAGQGAFRIHVADFVSTEEGTGVVHVAPGFGEDDYRLGLAAGLPAVCPVDDEGRFTDAVPDYAGREVKATDEDILRRLKAERRLVHRGTLVHAYPHCWRCDTPLIYRAISTWFVRVEALRDRLIENNRQIHWVPGHLRDGRFGKWLEGARDWAVSRNRFWGAPIPVWRSADGVETVCVGSVAELEERSGRRLDDLHKHFVDGVEIPSAAGRGPLRRVPEVLDCWFESGAMPYAQNHYPFENKDHFEAHFPADFIAEGLDQTRGWFYTLMVLSTALFDRPAFKHVVVNGLVLAADGRKMSKRLKNYPDPASILDTYGADALRLYLIASPVVRAEDLCFSEDGVKHALRHLLLPWWNAYYFFVTYARTDGWRPAAGAATAPVHLLDRWLLSALDRLTGEVTRAMDAYELQQAVRPMVRFIEQLTNWYIRRSRRRFWKSADDEDKRQAYATLYEALLRLARIAAPFVPFISDAIYRNLRGADMPLSAHLCDYPVSDGRARDPVLEAQMEDAMTVVGLGRQVRMEFNLKVRQPLARLHVVCRDAARRERLRALGDLMAEELNVREVAFLGHETDLADLSAQADFKRLGPRFGPRVKAVAAALRGLGGEACEDLLSGRPITLDAGGESVEIAPDEVVVRRVPRPGLAVSAAGDLVVGLEVELTPDLVREGLAREFVNKVQNMRKAADFDVSQRIRIRYETGPAVRDAAAAFGDYIRAETLAVDLAAEPPADGAGQAWDLNGHPCRIAVEPVAGP